MSNHPEKVLTIKVLLVMQDIVIDRIGVLRTSEMFPPKATFAYLLYRLEQGGIKVDDTNLALVRSIYAEQVPKSHAFKELPAQVPAP